MDADPTVLARLSEALRNELAAINQFLVHARMLEDWGFSAMSAEEYAESQEEHEHAKILIDRILLLGGTPDLQQLGTLRVGDGLRGVLAGDLAIEEEACATLKAGIGDCERAHDYVTRDLFTRILADEEQHLDHLRTALELMEKVGPQNYAQSRI